MVYYAAQMEGQHVSLSALDRRCADLFFYWVRTCGLERRADARPMPVPDVCGSMDFVVRRMHVLGHVCRRSPVLLRWRSVV